MKLSKRILSLLLSVLMMLGVVAGMQFSAGAIGEDLPEETAAANVAEAPEGEADAASGPSRAPAATYTLTYDANGGSGAPAAQTGTSVTVSTTKPTRSGYNFGGWAASASATKPSNDYARGKTITLTANKTIYAVWLASDENSVLFDMNGGSGGPAPVIHKTQYFFVPDTTPTRSGYTFLGWTDDSSSVATFFPDRCYKKVGGPVVLHAVWAENGATKTLSYAANAGGQAVSNLPASQNSTTGKWTISTAVPTRSGFTFLGWEPVANKSALSGRYRGGDQIVAGASITLYAIWAQDSATFYTLKFDANGGSNAPANLKHTGTASMPLTIPTRSGYRFKGWAKTSSNYTPDYIAGYNDYTDNFLKQTTATVYAVWEEYTITFNANGGSGGPTTLKGSGNITLPTLRPTRDTYSFVFWTKTKNSVEDGAWAPGQTYRLTEDVTLYAGWMKSHYLKYNYNGGTGNIASFYGYEVKVTTDKPTRSGYTFLGWATSSSATTPQYTGGETIYLDDNKDVTLYAVWKQYTLIYHANGGGTAPAAQTGGAVTIADYPTRSGYTCLGWATTATATSANTTYNKGKSVSLTADLHLYAVWQAAGSYTLTFDAKGGSGAPAALKHNGSVVLPTTRPTKDGCTFVGWAPGESNLTTYMPGDNYISSKNSTLYANWHTDGESLTLTYNGNGGSDTVTNMPASQTSTTGSWVVSKTIPAREGYTFLGWSLSGGKNGTVSVWDGGETIRFRSSVSLYAIWVPKSTTVYTLTFNANGGKGAPAEKKFTEKVVIPYQRPTRDGYVFLGWSKSASATTPTYSAGADVSNLTADTKLYAVWQMKNTVSFDANGGSGAPSAITTADSKITLPTTAPTRSGYTFLGWHTSATATNPLYAAGGIYGPVNSSAILYAIWAKSGTTVYTLTFNPNGGSGAPGAIKGNGTVQIPYIIPTRADYLFYGWATTSGGDAVYWSPGTLTLSKNMTLYAVWKQHTITFNANGGTGGPSSLKYGTGGTTLPTTAPTRSNYTFAGWGLSADAIEAAFQPGDVYPYYNGNRTLYAIWKTGTTYKLSFNADAGSETVTNMPAAQIGTRVIIPSNKPEREGYTFMGWYQLIPLSGSYYQPGDDFLLTSNTTLYASWAENNKSYRLTFDANGEGVTGLPSVISNTNGIWTIPTATPTRSGYTFIGWSITTVGCPHIFPGDTVKADVFGESRTLYAYWEKNEDVHTITYNANGGTGAPAAQKYGEWIQITKKEPTRSGYVFVGWGYASGDKKAVYQPGSTVQEGKDLTLYAIWAPSQGDIFVVRFNANGGSNAPNSLYCCGTFELPEQVPTWDKHKFLGWSTNQDATTAQYQPKASVGFSKDQTLYAIWEEITYVKGDLNGNGKPDAGDAVLVLRAATGDLEPTAEQITAGDINGNGKLDAGDAVLILRKATGDLEEWPA